MKKHILLIAAVVLTTSLASAATITARRAGDVEIAAIPNEAVGESTPKQAFIRATEKPTTATATTAVKTAKASTAAAEATAEAGLTFNFHNAPLDTVLDYMSKAGGFVIVKLVATEGRVNVTSHQPLNRTEAVDMLNTVLNENGFAAVRNGRILKIVSRDDAKTYDLEVIKKDNIDPKDMPTGDQMVHEIIPVRYADATAMLNDIQPLLPSWSTITANTASNSIVITDTKANIKRVAQIIKALDTSISEITTIEVYILQYSDATQVTDMINQLFASSGGGAAGGAGRNNRGAQMAQFFAQMRGGPGRMGGMGGMGGMGALGANGQQDSQARQAASRVLAVADTRTNAVVVSAPDELHPTIAKIIEQVDNTKELETQIRVFPLQYADATEMTDVITKMYTDSSTAASTMNQQRGGRGGMGGRGGLIGMGQVAAAAGTNGRSTRQIQEHTVTAVADTRTNSVIVIAVESVLEQVQKVVQNLDQDPSGHQKVYVYQIRNIDPEQAALMLQDMFQNGTSGNSSSSRSNSSSSYSSSTNRNNTSSNRNNSSSNRNSSSSNRSSGSSSFGSSSSNRSGSSRSY